MLDYEAQSFDLSGNVSIKAMLQTSICGCLICPVGIVFKTVTGKLKM